MPSELQAWLQFSLVALTSIFFSTAMVLMGQSRYWWQAIPVFVAIAFTALASYYTLAEAERVRVRLGETGIRVLMRLMGLVLASIAVQFVINGYADLAVTRRPAQ